MRPAQRERIENEDLLDHDDNPANRDPITGEPGAHPVGSGVGAAGGGTAGAAIGGAIGGPGGAIVGAIAGGIVGGLAGKGVAERIDPTVEEAYWRKNYSAQDYADANVPYEAYEPAYRVGYTGYGRYSNSGASYEEAEPELRREYESIRSDEHVDWEAGRFAARDAWHRVEKTAPQDSSEE